MIQKAIRFQGAGPFAIEAKGITLGYGSNTVFQDLDLKVKKGEMLGFIGPNGVGKTTLLRALSGSLKPQIGDVYLGAEQIQTLRPAERAKLLAMVSQNPVVPHGFTALQVVLMGRNPYLKLLQSEGIFDVEIALKAMEQTGTAKLTQRPIESLSGGERQLVFFARALAQETPVLLLDEPTAHLDIAYQTIVLDMVTSIRRQANLTIVAAMHDLTLAGQYCDRIAAFRDGSLFALGKPSKILTPSMISSVFEAGVSIMKHPLHKTPVVVSNRSHISKVRKSRN